ncbi:hypothetical protein VFPBJ_11514 [Purpureocillium lilacinum]|uniref:Cyanovirin-N domain-containing protein n=1 Tax=Purpureocillium lilacinum TaxID=33203 RepID=A0A179F6S4_PURLI|nr:hypothetical protein VFPBJ_11514 [Purpureocillium lilacinum]
MHSICGMGVSAAAMTMVVAATGIPHSSSKGSGDIISPAAVYLDGGSLAVLTSPCTDGDTLLECAQRYADSFTYPNATDLGINSISTLSTNTCLDGKTLSAKLNVSWKARLNTCTVTPQIVYTAGGIYCNSPARSKSRSCGAILEPSRKDSLFLLKSPGGQMSISSPLLSK